MSLLEGLVLGEEPHLTRTEVAEQAGVPLETALQLWHHLGFPHADDGERAFTSKDVEALQYAQTLIDAGVLSENRQAALVRTWGRSFARLAEWETSLLADVARERAGEGGDEVEDLIKLGAQVLPLVDALQEYVWRRHLASAGRRMLTVAGATAVKLAVGFVDIVGYTSQSKRLDEQELVDWIEEFEETCAGVVVDHGGRVIKSLGDAVLFAIESPVAAARIALELTARGASEEDPFPQIRAGVAYGDVVPRLGDVFGPTVNIASRLTSIARPSSVLVDEGEAEALADQADMDVARLRRTSVKGYSRLQPYRVRARSVD